MKYPFRFVALALLSAGLYAFCADTEQIKAQTPTPDSSPAPASAVAVLPNEALSVTYHDGSGAGQAVRAAKQHRRFERVALKQHQAIAVAITYSSAMAGQSIIIDAIDGGQVLGPDNQAVVGSDGVLRFNFQAGDAPGHYRVLVHDGADAADVLQFWVIDPNDSSTAAAQPIGG